MSLSDRLRAAALDRAQRSGQQVDGVVLEPTGVTDLRRLARDASRDVDHSVALPRLGTDAAESDRGLTDTALWRRHRPVPNPEPVIDLRDEPTIDLTEPATAPSADTTGVQTPVTAVCGRCGGIGQRDLFDRVSRTECFSCDACSHMWQQRRDD